MHVPLALGAWLEIEPGWILRDDADRLLAALQQELAWEQREIVLYGKRLMQPRLIAWGGERPYRYSGQTLEPRPMTPSLLPVLESVQLRTHVPFNHVLVNRYRDGNDSMGFHADDEAELGDNPQVATVSLGATRRFVLRPRRGLEREPLQYELEHGSLLIMGGTCQRQYHHGIPRQPSVRDERVSLTFRWLRTEPEGDDHEDRHSGNG
jgi:alkylated DNA repair dioxygenase AlkB